MIQNYQTKDYYNLRYAQYVAQLLSSADQEIFQMYSKGSWESAKAAAISETIQISISSQMLDDRAKANNIQFPLTVFGLRSSSKAHSLQGITF